MAWCRAEAAILVQAAEYKLEHAVPWQRIWMTEEVKCGQAPVDATNAQVFGKMVLKFLSALLGAVSAHFRCQETS